MQHVEIYSEQEQSLALTSAIVQKTFAMPTLTTSDSTLYDEFLRLRSMHLAYWKNGPPWIGDENYSRLEDLWFYFEGADAEHRSKYIPSPHQYCQNEVITAGFVYNNVELDGGNV